MGQIRLAHPRNGCRVSCSSCGVAGFAVCPPCARWALGERRITADGAMDLVSAVIELARHDFSFGMSQAKRKRSQPMCETDDKHKRHACAAPLLRRIVIARKAHLAGAFVDVDLSYIAADLLTA